MKKVALYSSSDRSRKKSSAAASSSDASGDASAPPAPPAPGRLRRFYQRFERPILLVAGALFAVALVLTYAKTRPAAHEYTQKDIDAAVLHTLETTQLPSFATKAFAAIEPSVVRVMGYGPEAADDDEKGKDKDASKDKDAPKDKGTFKVPGQDKEKDKLGRNDGGKEKPVDSGKGKPPGKELAEKAKDKAADKGKDDKPVDKGKDDKSARRARTTRQTRPSGAAPGWAPAWSSSTRASSSPICTWCWAQRIKVGSSTVWKPTPS